MKYDVVIIGGDDIDARLGIKVIESGRTCALICAGRISEDHSREDFRKMGGTLLLGDKVNRVEWSSSREVKSLFTDNLGGTPIEADIFVLCSGRFFTRGLVSDMERIFEPIFDLDVKFEKDRSLWCVEDFFAPQPFETFGVVSSPNGYALKGGEQITNLMVIGSILCDGQNNEEIVCANMIH